MQPVAQIIFAEIINDLRFIHKFEVDSIPKANYFVIFYRDPFCFPNMNTITRSSLIGSITGNFIT